MFYLERLCRNFALVEGEALETQSTFGIALGFDVAARSADPTRGRGTFSLSDDYVQTFHVQPKQTI